VHYSTRIGRISSDPLRPHLFLDFWVRPTATRSATATATCPITQHTAAEPGEGTAPGWGNISDAAPHAGLARHAKPGPILYALWVSKMSVARMTALPHRWPRLKPRAVRGHVGRPRRALPITWRTGASCRAM